MPENNNKIKLEDIDNEYCNGCQHKFDGQEECKTCLYTALYGEDDVDPEELEHLLKAMENGCLMDCRECLFNVLCYGDKL